MGKIISCEYCNKGFEYRYGKRFCTRSCASYFKARTKANPMAGRNGDKNPNWKGGNVKACEFCGTDFIDKHYDGKRFCSKTCSAKHNNSLRPVKAKPVKIAKVKPAKIVKEKIIKPPKQPVTKVKRLVEKKYKVCPTCNREFYSKDKKAKHCSRDCYHLSPDFAKLQGTRMRGKSLAEHVKQAVSKAVTARSTEKEFSYGKSGHHISAKAGSIFYRSSYEKIAYQMLDADDKVISYQPEPFVIMYVNSEGNTRRYRPDILVKKSRGKPVLIEVKPEWKMKDEKTILKIEAGKKYAKQKGWRFEVWTEKKLGI